jgi:hypothetical protein
VVVVIYEGASELNGKPIVGIITGIATPSSNRKTGPMAQLWILAANEEPHKAVKSGEDDAVCGDCPARAKWCYVTTFQGPLSIYRTWKRGGYQAFNPKLLVGLSLRLGAYGDPAALPLHIIEKVCKDVKNYTGYTHAWRYCAEEFQRYCMASADDLEGSLEAQSVGWRTFRVCGPDSPRQKGEVVCPAADESNTDISCIQCGACDGRRRPTVKSNIVIQAHGAKTKRYLEEFGNA